MVEHAVAGRFEMLKERTIAVELFGRDPSYDNAADSIVRVKANEVRKRLAQYYQGSGEKEGFQIHLPPGSYVPQFQDEAALPASRWRIALLGGLAALAVMALAVWMIPRLFPSDIDRFWAPVLASPGKVIVCMGTSQMVRVSLPLRRALEKAVAGETGAVADLKIQRGDFSPVAGDWVARGNFFALLDLALFFQKLGRPAEFRPTSEIAFDELRDQPIVLIGAYNNAWTMEVTQGLRFYFERPGNPNDPVWMIRDRVSPQRKWAVKGPHAFETDVDYAIITRLVDPSKHRTLLSAAGISWYGTQVAGDFITNSEPWREFARTAPKDWYRRNMQIVLETKVVGKTPTPAKVVATHFW